jgi:hypothetical protein
VLLLPLPGARASAEALEGWSNIVIFYSNNNAIGDEGRPGRQGGENDVERTSSGNFLCPNMCHRGSLGLSSFIMPKATSLSLSPSLSLSNLLSFVLLMFAPLSHFFCLPVLTFPH